VCGRESERRKRESERKSETQKERVFGCLVRFIASTFSLRCFRKMYPIEREREREREMVCACVRGRKRESKRESDSEKLRV